ncbi:hypothetical protein TKK_0003177 [Trichogramma kaykai]|uniref:Uncharacterized protein n=1 Tax=Trichogramma kaykai TaxID=54128 RepID=A0ABD2WSR2_9HYME
MDFASTQSASASSEVICKKAAAATVTSINSKQQKHVQPCSTASHINDYFHFEQQQFQPLIVEDNKIGDYKQQLDQSLSSTATTTFNDNIMLQMRQLVYQETFKSILMRTSNDHYSPKVHQLKVLILKLHFRPFLTYMHS